MQVKAGDLAIQIYSHANNEGKIVKVLRFVGHHKFLTITVNDAWECDYGSNVKDVLGGMAQIRMVPGSWLRPVSGLPMDEEVPDQIKEPV